MRAARIACTVGGIRSEDERPNEADPPLHPLKSAFVEERLYRFLHEEGGTAGGLDDHLLQGQQMRDIPEQGRKQFVGIDRVQAIPAASRGNSDCGPSAAMYSGR